VVTKDHWAMNPLAVHHRFRFCAASELVRQAYDPRRKEEASARSSLSSSMPSPFPVKCARRLQGGQAVRTKVVATRTLLAAISTASTSRRECGDSPTPSQS
jgi:hypothetical protein